MISKERVLTAVEHRPTDRVPITFDAEKEVYVMLYDRLNVKTNESLFDSLGVDTWMILPKNFRFLDGQENNEIKKTIWGYNQY